MDIRFTHGSCHLLSGASGSGKTYRVANYLRLKNELFTGGKDIKNIVYCYSTWQPIYDELTREKVVTRWINACPSNEEFIELVRDFKQEGGSIVIIDDFMGDISKELLEIVTVSSRHNNTTTFILFQCLFPPIRYARQISLNVKYFHLLKNPRENSQISIIARQIYPENWRWIVDSYQEATREPYSCFIIDVTQDIPEKLRFRSCILPSEFPITVWGKKGTLTANI